MTDANQTAEPRLILKRVNNNEFACGCIRIVQTGHREWYLMNPSGERITNHFTSARRAAMSINAELVTDAE